MKIALVSITLMLPLVVESAQLRARGFTERKLTEPDMDPLCEAHNACAHLVGPNCCPTQDDVMLDCCYVTQEPTATAAPTTGKGKGSKSGGARRRAVAEGKNNKYGARGAFVEHKTSTIEKRQLTFTETEPDMDPLCEAHNACSHLVGPNCCPTQDDVMLDCCYETEEPTAAPTTGKGKGSKSGARRKH